jgi:hypothetical protein
MACSDGWAQWFIVRFLWWRFIFLHWGLSDLKFSSPQHEPETSQFLLYSILSIMLNCPFSGSISLVCLHYWFESGSL